MTTPAPPGLVRPDTDPLPDPVALDGGIGRLRRAVAYSAPPGFRPLELDLYTPAGEPAPVILFVHGGGWRMGTREVFVPTLRDWRPGPFHRLVAAGFAVASVDYRLSAEAVFPAQLDDVRAALGYLQARAAELGVDASRVVAWGESAGAHLAALLGLTDSQAVAGVVDWYGPADLTTLAAQALPTAAAPGSRDTKPVAAPAAPTPPPCEPRPIGTPIAEAPDPRKPQPIGAPAAHPPHPREPQPIGALAAPTPDPREAQPTSAPIAPASDSRESQLIGAAVAEAPELARRASPVAYIHPGAPPFHIAHGDADRFVPAAQSRQLASALREAGVAVEFTEVPGADHLWMNAPDPEALFESAVDFARRVTRGAP
jgi:acetyl esterase/lipase